MGLNAWVRSLLGLQSAECEDAELRIQRQVLTMWGSTPLSPALFKGQMYIDKTRTRHTLKNRIFRKQMKAFKNRRNEKNITFGAEVHKLWPWTKSGLLPVIVNQVHWTISMPIHVRTVLSMAVFTLQLQIDHDASFHSSEHPTWQGSRSKGNSQDQAVFTAGN